MHTVLSEMPGTITEILVREGDAVSLGQELLVLESMKMEIPITASVAGVVGTIAVAVGDVIEAETALLAIHAT